MAIDRRLSKLALPSAARIGGASAMGSQGGGVIGFALGDQAPAHLLQAGNLVGGRRGRVDGNGPPTAAARQFRQDGKGGLGAAETAQQPAKGHGPDLLAAAEPQPGQAFVILQGLPFHGRRMAKPGKSVKSRH
jgi:hypothetical protein